MSARIRFRHAALATALMVSLSVAAGSPAAAQGDGLCGALTADDLSAAIPGTYDPPAGAADFCQWSGVSDSGSSVDVMAYTLPGSASDMPGAETIDIGGRPGFSMTDPVVSPPTHAIGVESGAGGLLVLTLGTADEGVDLPAAALALATTAVERLESGAVAAAPTSAPGASGPATGGAGLCTLATPEEIAAAAGLDVVLTLSEFDGTCSYDSITDDGYVLIYVAEQDPASFDASITALGAEEIDGPGETDWWSSSLASLFSRSGDQVVQVAYTASPAVGDEEARQAAIAIMSTLLAP